jgi:hypothetical protein
MTLDRRLTLIEWQMWVLVCGAAVLLGSQAGLCSEMRKLNAQMATISTELGTISRSHP